MEVLAGSRTAYHESGHAVACRALGVAVTDIHWVWRDQPNSSAYVEHNIPDNQFAHAVISLAGAAAVVIKFGAEYGALSDGDMPPIRELSPDELTAACERCVRLLHEHWAEVEKLAHELYPTNPTLENPNVHV